MFFLCNTIIGFGLAILSGIFGAISETLGMIVGFVYMIYLLAIIVPSIAVGVRRLHDTDKSGWWFLLVLIPFGAIVLLVFFCIDSTPGNNQYGSSEKYPEA